DGKVSAPVRAIVHDVGIDLKVKRPKGATGRQRSGFLSPEDGAAVIPAAKAFEPPFALLLKFLLYTGVRIGTALALRWDAVDLEKRLAYVGMTKNGDPITVLLRQDLAGRPQAVPGGPDPRPGFPPPPRRRPHNHPPPPR